MRIKRCRCDVGHFFKFFYFNVFAGTAIALDQFGSAKCFLRYVQSTAFDENVSFLPHFLTLLVRHLNVLLSAMYLFGLWTCIFCVAGIDCQILF